MTGDQRRELQTIFVDLEAEESDQQAAHGYAPPQLSRGIASLQQLTTPTDTVAGDDVSAATRSLRTGFPVVAPPR